MGRAGGDIWHVSITIAGIKSSHWGDLRANLFYLLTLEDSLNASGERQGSGSQTDWSLNAGSAVF